jgi:hypothetical protein
MSAARTEPEDHLAIENDVMRSLLRQHHAYHFGAEDYETSHLGRMTVATLAAGEGCTAVVPAPPHSLIVPAELTPDLQAILGIPNFQAGPIARVFREAGAPIPPKAEAEQAYLLHWLLRLAAEHGAAWRERAAEHIEGIHHAAAVEGAGR